MAWQQSAHGDWQQSANCGLSRLEAERRRLHVLTFRSATYKHLQFQKATTKYTVGYDIDVAE